MIPGKMKLIAGVLSVATLYACASATPRLDSSFGHTVNKAKMQQTLNPDAGVTAGPVTGLHGTPARETIERYHDSFKAPPPTFEVFFGGAGGGR
jgi:uncharacterized lipoprotein